MSNGQQQCCLAGVCCPAGSAQQLEAWEKLIAHERPQMTQAEVHDAAVRVLAAHNNFDDVVGLIDEPASV